MKALVYEGPQNLVLRDWPDPELSDNEVLVEPLWNGICGSDLHAYQHVTPRRTPPMVMGHEFSGRIIDPGNNNMGLKSGQIIVACPVHWCGKCDLCRNGKENLCPHRKVIGVDRPGSYAERVAVNAEQCFLVPDGLDPMIAALAEPLAVAVHAMNQAGCVEGKEVVIIGAGTIGLMAIPVARSLGAGGITAVDIREKSLELAARLGAGTCINAAETESVDAVRQGTGGKGAAIALEAVGSEGTIQQAIGMVEPGGTVVLMGMGPQYVRVDALDIVAREVRLCGTYVSGKDFKDAIPLLEAHQQEFASLVGPVWPFDQAVGAFEDYDARQSERFKVMISDSTSDLLNRTNDEN